MKPLAATLAVALASASLAAQAAHPGLSYNYVQAGYVSLNPDNFPGDVTGYDLGLSAQVSEPVFLFGGYSSTETDTFSSALPPATGTFEFRNFSAGVGLRGPLGYAPDTDANVTAGWVRQESKGKGGFAGFPETTNDGYSLGLGFRHLFSPTLEMGIGADYTNLPDTSVHHTTGTANVLFHLLPQFSLVGAYAYNSSLDGWLAGVRVNF